MYVEGDQFSLQNPCRCSDPVLKDRSLFCKLSTVGWIGVNLVQTSGFIEERATNW